MKVPDVAAMAAALMAAISATGVPSAAHAPPSVRSAASSRLILEALVALSVVIWLAQPLACTAVMCPSSAPPAAAALIPWA